MNTHNLVIGLLLVALEANSQTVNNNNSYLLEAYDVKGRPFTSEVNREIRGTPMFTDSWGLGNVVFEKGRAVRQIELKFNLVRNEVYFKKEDMVLTFLEPVLEFSFAYDSTGEKKYAYFKRGYPTEGSRTNANFYQVLADGKKVQLVKYVAKIIMEEFSYGTSPTKSYKLVEEYYIYDIRSSQLFRLKKNLSAISKALPEYTKALNQFMAEKGYKFRSEQEMLELVNYLNE